MNEETRKQANILVEKIKTAKKKLGNIESFSEHLRKYPGGIRLEDYYNEKLYLSDRTAEKVLIMEKSVWEASLNHLEKQLKEL